MTTTIPHTTTLRGVLIREKIFPGILFVLMVFLAFYNLAEAPITWNDEGAAMLVARSVVENGKYGVRSSDGFQTFGPVQSVGPTVILPVALSFKLFGIGVLQGRIVAAVYMCMTLFFIYKVAKLIFGKPAALLGLLFMVGSTSAQFLYFGRQTLGEVPALGFLMGGLYFWIVGSQKGSMAYRAAAGVMVGLAMITKSSYAPLVGVMFGILILLDMLYYRQKMAGSMAIIAVIGFMLFGLWVLAQRIYFGPEVFRKNSELMGQLFGATSGFSLKIIVQQAKFLVGYQNDSYYFLWGIPALFFGAGWCMRKDIFGFTGAALLLFIGLWLGYYFYSVPWPAYLFVPASLTGLFLGRLWVDLVLHARLTWNDIMNNFATGRFPIAGLQIALGVLLFLSVSYPLQNALQFNVTTRNDTQIALADFLNREIPPGTVVETWDKQLGILTAHNYHFPGPEILLQANESRYRGNLNNDLLGYDYFNKARPSYLVIGRFERESPVYDREFMAANTELLSHIGADPYSYYEIYKVNYPLTPSK